VCLGVWILRRIDPELERPFRTPLVPLVPILGAASCVLMMFGLGIVTWLRFLIWMAAGFLIYFGYGRFHSRVAIAEENSEGRLKAAE
ncbi:MAG TPA: amino acid permease C-terminal domain-containing protein, partial [Candidatus Binataceae bacterium]|nr:amino acid permease C-terminal domain-containing protein [Candidatus Binataceae bacterium]